MKAPKETITLGGLQLDFLLDGEDTNNQMVMFELTIKAGAKVPVPHYHIEVDEALYGLEGTLTSIVDGQSIETGPGDRLFITRGQTHYHDNLSDKDTKVLCVLTPASIGPAYFRELKAILIPGTPPDPQKSAEIMLRHGLIPVV
ncbi:cupin domain-containing protein [Mucilaginibacter sp. AW1-3]